MRYGLGILLAVVLALGVVTPAHTQQYVRQGQLSQSWSCSLSALAATLTQCQALTTGKRHYITDITVGTTTTTSGTYAIQYGTGTNCGTGTAALFPVVSTSARFNAPITSSPMAHFHFITPLVPTVGSAICVIGVATNTINIQLQGFTAP